MISLFKKTLYPHLYALSTFDLKIKILSPPPNPMKKKKKKTDQIPYILFLLNF